MLRNAKTTINERFDKLSKRGKIKISTIVSVTKQLREHQIKWKEIELCPSRRAVIVTYNREGEEDIFHWSIQDLGAMVLTLGVVTC